MPACWGEGRQVKMPGASDKFSPISWPPDSGTLAIFSLASDAILAFDSARKCIWANRSACDHFPRQALVGGDIRSIVEQFSSENRAAVEQLLGQDREAQGDLTERLLHHQPTCDGGSVLQLQGSLAEIQESEERFRSGRRGRPGACLRL